MSHDQNTLSVFQERSGCQSETDTVDSQPWPDSLPEALQRTNYPPIRSTDVITESGSGSNIRVGDADCYRIQDGNDTRYFGFLLLQQFRDEVNVYVLHTEAYSTISVKALEDGWLDHQDQLETATRKIYRSVTKPNFN